MHCVVATIILNCYLDVQEENCKFCVYTSYFLLVIYLCCSDLNRPTARHEIFILSGVDAKRSLRSIQYDWMAKASCNRYVRVYYMCYRLE